MKPKPLPAEPTNADLAKGQVELHECLEDVSGKLSEHAVETTSKLIELTGMIHADRVANTERHVAVDKLLAATRKASHDEYLTLSGQFRAMNDALTGDRAQNEESLTLFRQTQARIAGKLGVPMPGQAETPHARPFFMASISPRGAMGLGLAFTGAASGLFAILRGLEAAWPAIQQVFNALIHA